MSQQKKLIRKQFNEAVFNRDGHCCAKCGATNDLDAHHITDRKEIPNGGYVKENGISLCPECHIKAEAFHCGEDCEDGFWPRQLYEIIGSSRKIAFRKADV